MILLCLYLTNFLYREFSSMQRLKRTLETISSRQLHIQS